MKARWILSLLVTLVAARAEAISTAPGYAAHSIPTSGTVQGGASSNFLTGFGFTAGLALAADDSLFVGDVDGTTFKGSILHFGLDGAGRGSLASGLEGTFDLVVNADGNVLVSGIHNDAFSDSMVLAIAPDGTVLQPPLADGFAFSTGMFFDAT